MPKGIGYRESKYKGIEVYYLGDRLIYVVTGWKPDQDAEQALLVLEWLRKQTWFSITNNPEYPELVIEFGNRGEMEAEHKDFKTAICLAWLEYMENEDK